MYPIPEDEGEGSSESPQSSSQGKELTSRQERVTERLAKEPTYFQMEVTVQEVVLELLEEEEEEGEMSQVIQEGMMDQMEMEMQTLKKRMTVALLQQG